MVGRLRYTRTEATSDRNDFDLVADAGDAAHLADRFLGHLLLIVGGHHAGKDDVILLEIDPDVPPCEIRTTGERRMNQFPQAVLLILVDMFVHRRGGLIEGDFPEIPAVIGIGVRFSETRFL
jgi:hypothetical protein